MNTLFLCAVFIVGFIFGAVGHYLWIRPKAKKMLEAIHVVTDILEQAKSDIERS